MLSPFKSSIILLQSSFVSYSTNRKVYDDSKRPISDVLISKTLVADKEKMSLDRSKMFFDYIDKQIP